jgi:hypothetical protein
MASGIRSRFRPDESEPSVIVQHTVGNALVLHPPDQISPEAQSLALTVVPDTENDIVVIDFGDGMPVGSWEVMAKSLPRRRRGIRLMACGRYDGMAVMAGQWLSERLNRTVIAPDGELQRAAGGALFVHSRPGSGWVRFRPGRAASWHAKRYPTPTWDKATTDVRPSSAHGQIEPLPGGVWIHHTENAETVAAHRRRLVADMPCQYDRLTVVLGCPGTDPLSLDDVIRFWRRLDPETRAKVRFVEYGAIRVPEGEPAGQAVADQLNSNVVFYTGVPIGVPSDFTLRTVQEDGTLGWPPFARELGYVPRAHPQSRARRPLVLSYRAPLPWAEEVENRQYWYAPDAVVEVVQSGLWIRGLDEPANAEKVRGIPLDIRGGALIFDDSDPVMARRMQELATDLAARLDAATAAGGVLVPASVLAPGVRADGQAFALADVDDADVTSIEMPSGTMQIQAPVPAPPAAIGSLPVAEPVYQHPAFQESVYPEIAYQQAAPQEPAYRLPADQEPAFPQSSQPVGERPTSFPSLDEELTQAHSRASFLTQPDEPNALTVRPEVAVVRDMPGEGQSFAETPSERTGRFSVAHLRVSSSPVAVPPPAAPPEPIMPAEQVMPPVMPPEPMDPVEPVTPVTRMAPVEPIAPVEPGMPVQPGTAPFGSSLPPAELPAAETHPAETHPAETHPASSGMPAQPSSVPPPPPAPPVMPSGLMPVAVPDLDYQPVARHARHAASEDRAPEAGAPEPAAPGQSTPGDSTPGQSASDRSAPEHRASEDRAAEDPVTPNLGSVAPSVSATPVGDPAPADDVVRVQPIPVAPAVAAGQDLVEERAWLRRTLSREFDTLSSSVSRIMSEHPGLSTPGASSADVLADAVAVRLLLSRRGPAIDAALRTGENGPHVPLARSAVSGLYRLPSGRGSTMFRMSPTPEAWHIYRDRKLFTDWGFVTTLSQPCESFEGDTDVLIWSMTGRRTTLLEPENSEHIADRVVFLPGTSFKLLELRQPTGDGRGVVLLREIGANEIDDTGRVDTDRVSLDELAVSSLHRSLERWTESPAKRRIGKAARTRFNVLPGLVGGEMSGR